MLAHAATARTWAHDACVATEFWWWWLQDAKPKYTHGVSAATAIVNYNASPNDPNRPTSMPIYQSSTFIQPSATEFQVGSSIVQFFCGHPKWSLVESSGRSLSYRRLNHVGLDRVKYARTHAYKNMFSLCLSLMIYLCRILFSVTCLPTGLRLHSLWQPYSLGSRDPSCRFRNVCTCLLVLSHVRAVCVDAWMTVRKCVRIYKTITLLMYLPTYLSICHPSVHPFKCSSMDALNYLFIYTFECMWVCTHLHTCIYLPICLNH